VTTCICLSHQRRFRHQVVQYDTQLREHRLNRLRGILLGQIGAIRRPASDLGSGEGTGYTVNLPVPGGSGDETFRSLVDPDHPSFLPPGGMPAPDPKQTCGLVAIDMIRS